LVSGTGSNNSMMMQSFAEEWGQGDAGDLDEDLKHEEEELTDEENLEHGNAEYVYDDETLEHDDAEDDDANLEHDDAEDVDDDESLEHDDVEYVDDDENSDDESYNTNNTFLMDESNTFYTPN
jgi:hypothetical protein